ncbi:hypothetical protein CONPUDRAFT_41162, partial [Coniophora puteana RWD-64-598 SS2]
MVCLNLPPHLRYKLENVYLVGVIPGPREPSLDQVNHLLQPLVDDLLCLWVNGIRLNRTYKFSGGRIVRVALGPLVCDLPAARKTAGFAGHSADLFCSFCRLSRKDISNLVKASWPERSSDQHLHDAKRWKNAKNEGERQKMAMRRGTRWSELLRLTYWDPLKFTVLDAMHNLFLGEFQHHCRVVWG